MIQFYFHIYPELSWCAVYRDAADCRRACGFGAAQAVCQMRGRGDETAPYKYRTCSPDLNTCPDGRCDELEELSGICPQDCIGKWFCFEIFVRIFEI